MTSSTKATVQAFYDALNRGDVPGLKALFADHIACTEAERFPYYSGTWTRFDEVVEKLLIPIGRDWSQFAATSHQLIGEGGEVVSFGFYSGIYRKTGESLNAPFAHHWKLEHGKITDFKMYTDTAKVLEVTRG